MIIILNLITHIIHVLIGYWLYYFTCIKSFFKLKKKISFDSSGSSDMYLISNKKNHNNNMHADAAEPCASAHRMAL